jgi:hypothetical protein
MKARQLVERLFGADELAQKGFQSLVTQVMQHVEGYLGDVITDETSENEAKEEAWTLAIDYANETFSQMDRAKKIEIASEACAKMGYPPRGYRQKKRPDDSKTAKIDLQPEPERPLVKPTGVKHGVYRPNIPNFNA